MSPCNSYHLEIIVLVKILSLGRKKICCDTKVHSQSNYKESSRIFIYRNTLASKNKMHTLTVQTLSAHESRVKASAFRFTSTTTPKPVEIWQWWQCQAEQIQQRYSHLYCIDIWWWNCPHPATVCSLWGDRWLVRSTVTPLWNLQKTKSVDRLLLLLSLWLSERSPAEHSRGYPVCNCAPTNAFHRVIGLRVAGFFMNF